MITLKNKILALGGFFFVFFFALSGQNGTFLCTSQGFTNDQDPSKNKTYSDKAIVMIDIYDFGGNLKVNFPTTEVIYNWNIKKKLDVVYDREKGIVITTYLGVMSIADIEGTKPVQIALIEDVKNKDFTIAIGDKGIYNWYRNLEKL